ncbi:MAG: U32 family peptidase [Oscillospiraceae bacterium]|nr:U32 family peptidase [Oscillospiraceae bacterium]
MKKLELLAPAGDMERLRMALHYGADAVYLAGTEFGMRASAGNFDESGLREAVRLCHEKGAAVHVACNTLPREDELSRLPAYLGLLGDIGADALIVADLGVLALAKKYAPGTALHVSTQLGVVNSEACKALFDMGVSRAVLARELSLDEIRRIRKNAPPALALEAFVHGAMCVSFSGRCLLSNYLAGRDANRGDCAQPCRWKYHLVEEKRPGEYLEISEDGGSFILNSSDLCMIAHLPELIDAGVTSFKLEGRMKSAYYTAVVTNAYRHALDAARADRPLEQVWIDEVGKIRHRKYTTGFYFGQPGQNTSAAGIYFSSADVCAVVESCDGEGNALLTQRNKFSECDAVELLTNDGEPLSFTAGALRDGENRPISAAPHPLMPVRMRLPRTCAPLSLLRKSRTDAP